MVDSTAKLTTVLLVGALAAMPGLDVHAQAFPAKPVRFIVPFATGGASDIMARAVGQKLGEMWGQTVASSPDRFAAFIREEIDKWGKLVRASGARAD